MNVWRRELEYVADDDGMVSVDDAYKVIVQYHKQIEGWIKFAIDNDVKLEAVYKVISGEDK